MSKPEVDSIDDQGVNERYGLTNAEVEQLGTDEWTGQFFESLKELRLISEQLQSIAYAFHMTGNNSMNKTLNVLASRVVQERNVVERIILVRQKLDLETAQAGTAGILQALVGKIKEDDAAQKPV